MFGRTNACITARTAEGQGREIYQQGVYKDVAAPETREQRDVEGKSPRDKGIDIASFVRVQERCPGTSGSELWLARGRGEGIGGGVRVCLGGWASLFLLASVNASI